MLLVCTGRIAVCEASCERAPVTVASGPSLAFAARPTAHRAAPPLKSATGGRRRDPHGVSYPAARRVGGCYTGRHEPPAGANARARPPPLRAGRGRAGARAAGGLRADTVWE